jgi:putative ABC transport system permease protein
VEVDPTIEDSWDRISRLSINQIIAMEGNSVRPPKWTLRFLEWYCPSNLYEGIEGDLLENFEIDCKAVGEVKARRKFILHAFRFFRPEILLRNRLSFKLINTIMLTNYFVIAYRNVLKNKIFSAINVFGLGIGLAACLLIFQFVTFELSYDKFNDKFDRMYRVTNDRFQNGKLIQHGTIMYPTIGPTMAKDYPEIEEYTRIMPNGDMNVKSENELFRIENSHFVDDHFLSVFSFPLLAGDRAAALTEPYTLVITKELADKLYGVSDGDYKSVLGKVVYQGLDPQPIKITGVTASVPENSHMQFDALISYATLIRPEDHGADDSWTWSDMRHYLVLKPGTDFKSLESKFDAFSEQYFKGDKVSGSIEKFYLQPMSEAHLYSDYEYDIAKKSNGKAVWAMLIVAGFILLIAWINYINLTTSKALDRAKEVGLRKVMGAFKSQLIKQFIFESLLISFLAFSVAIAIVLLVQNSFNGIVGGNLSLWRIIGGLSTSSIALLFVVLALGVLLSGFYPAFVLSSYQPVTILKGKFQRSSKGQFLRKALVIFQFTASAALITGTVIVSQQLKFMDGADLGINIKNTMIVRGPERTAWDSTFISRVESYKHELTGIKGVVSAATTNNLPGSRLGRAFNIRLSGEPVTTRYTVSTYGIDYNFFDTYQVEMLAGRRFFVTDHKEKFEDLNTIVINLNTVNLLGIKSPEEAIGKEIAWGNNKIKMWRIIGVIKNFHQESLKNPMEAMVFRPFYATYSPTSIRIGEGDRQAIIAQVETVYKKFFPDNAFEYSFLEDTYKRQYNDDNRFGTIVTIFTVLAIIISCLGLIGLSSYTAIQRTKEIGIRKVLGASMFSIVSLLSSDFIKLILFATLISLPMAYYATDNWLTGYAYRITLGWLMFLVPVILILLIAALTMSFQIIKTAMTNPAETLKYE